MKTLTSQSKQQIIRLLSLLILTYGVGFFIMAFLQTPEQMAWYRTMQRSSLTPPPIVFSIVWTILYALMAVSASLVWNKGGRFIFFVQLLLQILWSYAFFVAHTLWLGFVILVLLSITVGWMTMLFYKLSKWAGLLIFPYFIWCLFASYLNLVSAFLN